MTGSSAIAALDGATLLTERAVLGGFRVPGSVSAGGGCRLYDAADGVVALNLARETDRELLPALFADAGLDPDNDAAIAARFTVTKMAGIVARGRELGLAIAGENEPVFAPVEAMTVMQQTGRVMRPRRMPRVLDLSSLWAGPLCGHLLWIGGAEVVKVESQSRPDAMRADKSGFFDIINQGKSSVVLDLGSRNGIADLHRLIEHSDIVIEASRPRALLQLGIDADDMVRRNPALVWMTITAHGAVDAAANWVGFGDDTGFAAGLGAASRAASGRPGFVGDAIADPLTGIATAVAAWNAWATGHGGRYGISMRNVVARALSDEKTRDPFSLEASLKTWVMSAGQLITGVSRRMTGEVAGFGIDTQRVLAAC